MHSIIEQFAFDKEIADLSFEDRLDLRLSRLKPKLEAFFEWCESISVLDKSNEVELLPMP